MEGRITFDFTDLLPQIEAFFGLLRGDVAPEGISSFFIFLLLLIFFYFLIVNVFKDWLWAARPSIKFFEHLLHGLTTDILIDERQNLKQRASQSNNRLGKLWEEFDETLVVSEGEKQLQNTYDAAHFFNTHSLARGITENRLLAAVPGFLTAVGVVGTFTGLFLGLSNINPEDVGSISRLIQGASIAFKTSVWGVTLSLIFSFIEKLVEQRVRARIAKLQDQIDTLFPRLSPEQTLVHVHEATRQAAITLDGLSERIGNKMQETVSQVAQNVQTAVVEGLQQVLQPALESLAQTSNDLAERQARGGAEALENLIRQFSDGLRGQGEQQRKTMEATTAEVKTAISQWGGSMTRFMETLEKLNQDMDAREQTRTEAFEERFQASQDALTRHVDQLQQQITRLLTDHANRMQAQTQAHLGEWTNQAEQASNAMGAAVETFSDSLRGQGEQQQTMMQATTAEVKTAIGQWSGSMAHFMDALEALNQRMDARESARAESFDGYVQKSQTVLQQSQKLYEQIETITQGLQTSASEMRTGSELLNNASGGLRTLSERLQSGVNQLDQTLGRVLDQTRRLSEENEVTGRNINQVIGVLTGLRETFSGAADVIVEASTASRDLTNQLKEHQQQLFETLKDHIDQLQQQVAQLLTDYTNQVQTQTQDRLNEWTAQTQQYTTAMEGAVQSIASVVEEIDGTIGRRR